MKKLFKHFVTHVFLYIGIICFCIVSFNIGRYFIIWYNATPVQCEITKVVNTKEDYLEANHESNERNYEYGTYVDYSFNDVKYNDILVTEHFGHIGETVKLFANKYEPTRLFYLGGIKFLILKLVAIEGVVCVVIEVYLNYRRKGSK